MRICLALALLVGCASRSKEQEREIAQIKQRVVSDPASLNVDDGSGSPLDIAVINNYLDLAEWLVEHHADLNARNRRGSMALHEAVIADRAPDYKMIHFLLRSGADVNARRAYDETPLHEAASLGLTEAARILVEHGADVNARAGRGETPLHIASNAPGYPDLVDLLLAHGADIEAQQNNGATALHQAVLSGNTKVVELLLRRGASTSARNQAGDAPVHYAAATGKAEAAELLLTHHADVNAVDRRVGIRPCGRRCMRRRWRPAREGRRL